LLSRLIDSLFGVPGRALMRTVEELGKMATFSGEMLQASLGQPIRWKVLFEQLMSIGVRSSFVVLLTGLFTGLVFALQTSYAFRLFGADSLSGSAVLIALLRELGPVLTALMVTARAGSAMSTELGVMRVTEQIDALYSMAVSPMAYLVVPRILATTIMVPLLSIFFSFLGFAGTYGMARYVVGVSHRALIDNIMSNVAFKDMWSGGLKAMIFGFIVALICTQRGYFASGGARGVGRATTEAVVLSSVLVLVADYFVTVLLFGM